MNSATSFKISFTQDKKTKLFFLKFDIYTIIYLQYIQHVLQLFHDLRKNFPDSYIANIPSL